IHSSAVPSASLPLSLYCYGAHRDLHSFPTRRSSDLKLGVDRGQRRLGLLLGVIVRGIHRRAVAHQERLGIGRLLVHLDAHVAERSEEHTSELQSRENLVCRLLLEKKKKTKTTECAHN